MTGVELRWLIRRNTVTAEKVSQYRQANSVSMMAAKNILQDERGPVLQYRTCTGVLGQLWTDWKDVPTEVITE